MKILFISRHYLDDNNGGANATKGFIHTFASAFGALDLIYPEHDNTDCSSYVPSSCNLFPCYDKRSKLMKVVDMYRGRVHRFTDFVKQHLQTHLYDVIIIDHSILAATLIETIKKTNARIITIHHNVEKYYLADNEPSIIYRYPYDHFCKKAEIDALLNSNINLTLTEKDAETFKSWYPSKNLHLHNIGICEYRQLTEPQYNNDITETNTFIITGSLCFKQSLLPIMDFLSNYYPLLKEECPTAKLIIAGRNPSEELKQKCAEDSSIELIANPEDMNEVVQRANYYICPINAGSGIKLRILDGLKQGLPVMAHEVASRGYDYVESAGCLFTYHDKDSFKSALSSLLKSESSKTEVFNAFKHSFSLEACISRLKDILNAEGINV